MQFHQQQISQFDIFCRAQSITLSTGEPACRPVWLNIELLLLLLAGVPSLDDIRRLR